jgi:hypothetical protein
VVYIQLTKLIGAQQAVRSSRLSGQRFHVRVISKPDIIWACLLTRSSKHTLYTIKRFIETVVQGCGAWIVVPHLPASKIKHKPSLAAIFTRYPCEPIGKSLQAK